LICVPISIRGLRNLPKSGHGQQLLEHAKSHEPKGSWVRELAKRKTKKGEISHFFAGEIFFNLHKNAFMHTKWAAHTHTPFAAASSQRPYA